MKNYQLNRLSSLALMAKGVAKKIEPSLETLIHLAKKVQRDWQDSSFCHHYQQEAIKKVDAINDLCRNLVEMSLPREKKIEKVKATELLDHVQELLAYDGGQIKVSADDLLWFWGDKAQLIHVLVNVGANAVQASVDESSDVEIYLMKNCHGDIHITVKDFGIGISSQHVPYIFDPFFSTKANHVGLGLTIADRIIKNFEGKIVLASNKNGTSVDIKFPEVKEIK